MKTLVLIPPIRFYCFNRVRSEKVVFIRVIPMLLVKFYSIIKKLGFKKEFLFYGTWKYKKFKSIIIFDSTLLWTPSLLDYLKRNYKDIKVSVYKWNIIRNEGDFNIYKNLHRSQVYDYDKNQAAKYSFKYNSIFYNEKYLMSFKKKNVIKYDVFYLGASKDRLLEIIESISFLKRYDFTYKIIIIGENTMKIDDPNVIFTKRRISYLKYLKMANKSNVILDIAKDNQRGLSLRFMESIFLKKKLITTNRFYSDFKSDNLSNICYINDKESNIVKFKTLKFKDYTNYTKKYYSIDEWVERFENE